MKLFHYVEIENFKRFGATQRINLEHPSVLIGPNNCGKTSAIQAIALWSQSLKTWYEAKKGSSARERTATSLNRLSITAVPVRRTRFFWHDTKVRTGNQDIRMTITVAVEFKNQVIPLKMNFRNQGEDLVYCTPDDSVIENTALLEHAVGLDVHMLYPMSGLETEEPVLQPGRIDVLLGQGQTAQVLRNLCLIVHRQSPEDWQRIVELMKRLFSVDLEVPEETVRGAIALRYRQSGVKEKLELGLSGRGFQQLLLIFSYLFTHKKSVLLIDEPDAHLEILRQKQVYVLLRDIASRNSSQVILVTHSEVVLEEALDVNLTLLLEGRADDLAAKKEIKNSLKHYGAAHYVKARQRGYVLYVEGSTDLDILKAFAVILDHEVANVWDPQINSFYVKDNYPDETCEANLERVEGGFGVTPPKHFYALRETIPDLRGLAILDSDSALRDGNDSGGLKTLYWKRYEIENYFVTPKLLQDFAEAHYAKDTLFGGYKTEIKEVLDEITLSMVFDDVEADFKTYRESEPKGAALIWNAKTERNKLSAFAEAFFRQLAEKLGALMLLRKGEFHRLVMHMSPEAVDSEVRHKLDCLLQIFRESPDSHS